MIRRPRGADIHPSPHTSRLPLLRTVSTFKRTRIKLMNKEGSARDERLENRDLVEEDGAATVAFKLSVERSFFEYLRAAGVVPLSLASAQLVSPPELPSEPAGRATFCLGRTERSRRGPETTR
jgi:hypothetical protein